MRSLGSLVVLASAIALASSAVAGEYHRGPTLLCADCHIMHGSQQHGYNSDGTGNFTPIGGAAPYTYLLRNEINDLCLTCHDNSTFVPDVLGSNSSGTVVRSAGALNRSGAAPYYHQTGHTLDSTDVAPGGTWSNADGLHCTDCHSQHGSDSYRNFQTGVGDYARGTNAVTYIIGATNDLTYDVWIGPNGGSTIYETDRINWNETDPTGVGTFEGSPLGHFCAGCHTDFFGAPGGTEIGGSGSPPEEFHRHPSSVVNIGEVGGGHSSLSVYASKDNKVKVMSESGVWDGSVGDVTPTCISCHKGHGNQNAFGLIYMSGITGAVLNEQGDSLGSKLEDLCKQCHRQGG